MDIEETEKDKKIVVEPIKDPVKQPVEPTPSPTPVPEREKEPVAP